MATSFPAASRPTATKAVVVPAGTSARAGLTAIDSSGPGTTSITVDAATRPEATTNRAVPARSPRKRPLSSSSPIASARLQVGASGTALPPASCPTARNCRSDPLTTVGLPGSRAIVTNGPGVTSTRASPRRSPAAATTVASPARPAVRTPRSSRSPTSRVRLHSTVTPEPFGSRATAFPPASRATARSVTSPPDTTRTSAGSNPMRRAGPATTVSALDASTPPTAARTRPRPAVPAVNVPDGSSAPIPPARVHCGRTPSSPPSSS